MMNFENPIFNKFCNYLIWTDSSIGEFKNISCTRNLFIHICDLILSHYYLHINNVIEITTLKATSLWVCH